MSKVYTGASMSLDGYVSGPEESGFEHLFKWYGNGDIEVPTADPELTTRMTPENVEHWRTVTNLSGALVVGRKLFDFTNGWGGLHPLGVPVVVLTHSVPEGWEPDGEWFTFVTDGIEAAIEKAHGAGGRQGGRPQLRHDREPGAQRRLLDEVWIDLVPVVLGGGTPFFSGLDGAPFVLEGPLSIGDGRDVTHLRYKVRYA